jgi:hypothetical protein
MHPADHAKSSAKKFGGTEESHFPLHHWFDATKSVVLDIRHRALRHHDLGIRDASRLFKEIPDAQKIGDLHCTEDLGFIPSIGQWAFAISEAPVPFKGGARQDLVERFRGKSSEYDEILNWFFEPREMFETPLADYVRFHSLGTFDAEDYFGRYYGPRQLKTRYVAEQIVKSSYSAKITPLCWIQKMNLEIWMQSRKGIQP